MVPEAVRMTAPGPPCEFRAARKVPTHPAVDAGRNRHSRDTVVDQLGGFSVVTTLPFAYRGGDVLRYFVDRATVGRQLSVDSASKTYRFSHTLTRGSRCVTSKWS